MKALKTSVLVVPLLILALVACRKDGLTPTISVPDGDIVFFWNDTESQTVTVESDYDWSFEEVDEYDIIEVSRTEGSNTLVITPNINYASKSRTATINITADSGSGTAQKSITVSQGANAETYLEFLDSHAGEDYPSITFSTKLSDESVTETITLATNNVISVRIADEDVAPSTKVAIENVAWLSYELEQTISDDGIVVVIYLTSEINPDYNEALSAAIDIVAGNENIENTIVTKTMAIVSLGTAGIVVNPSDGLVFAFDETGPQTFTIAANVDYDMDNGSWIYAGSSTGSDWPNFPTITRVKQEGYITTYQLTIDTHTSSSDRQIYYTFGEDASGDFTDRERITTSILVTQTAAPTATVSLDQSSLVFNNDETQKLVGVESSMPAAFINITCTDESGGTADWLSAVYNEAATALVVSVTEATSEEKNGTITVTVGSGANLAYATVSVTRLSTEPSVVLNPSSVTLNQNGDAVTVSVITNQSSWSVNSSASSDFTLTPDYSANTITVSGSAISSGERSATYTVTAGTATAELTVSQRVAYQLGDPYVVNGKTVGIVYEVDEDGLHGKAFSLMVYNLSDKYFFYEPVGWVGSTYGGAWIDDGAVPTSLTDGKLNCQTMKNEPDWSSKFLALKWVEDLAASQGVEWYIPAIEELKTLVSYMSDAEFIEDEMDTSDTDKIETAWDRIREVYSQYTASSPDYSEEQYVVFQWCTYDASGNPYQIKDLRHYSTDPYEEISDNYAYVWYSSSVVSMTYNQWLYTVNMQEWQSIKGYPVVRNNTGAVAYYDDYEYQAGSVHPICQF